MAATFQSAWDGYDETLIQGITTNVSTGLSAVAPYLVPAVSLYVLLTGLMMMYGAMTWNTGVRRLLRCVLMTAALTPAYFNQFIVTGFTQDIPTALSAAVNGGSSAAQADASAQSFDQLLASIEAMNAQTQATGGSNPFNLPGEISAYIAAGLGEFSLLLSFCIWFFARALVGIVVCVGPFVLPMYLFEATKGIAERYFAKLITLMILLLMVFIVNMTVQQQNKTYVQQIAAGMIAGQTPDPAAQQFKIDGTPYWESADGMWSTSVPTAGPNLDAEVQILWNVAIVFGIGTFIMLALPAIAAFLGGGIAVSITPIIGRIGGRRIR